MIWNDILFFGDSLTYGSRDEKGRSFPIEMIKYFANENIKLRPIIEAYPSKTSSDLLRISGLKSYEYRDIKEVVIQCGTNDTKTKVSPKDFINNVGDITEIFFDKKIYILEIATPKGFGSVSYSKDNLKVIMKYNKALKQYCINHQIEFIELPDNLEYIDGIHYTNKTNKRIAETIFEKIKKTRKF